MYALDEFNDSGQLMIVLKHNQHHQIAFYHTTGCYKSHTTAKQKSKVKELRVKSPAKANTNLHNGDLKFQFFSFSDSAC